MKNHIFFVIICFTQEEHFHQVPPSFHQDPPFLSLDWMGPRQAVFNHYMVLTKHIYSISDISTVGSPLSTSYEASLESIASQSIFRVPDLLYLEKCYFIFRSWERSVRSERVGLSHHQKHIGTLVYFLVSFWFYNYYKVQPATRVYFQLLQKALAKDFFRAKEELFTLFVIILDHFCCSVVTSIIFSFTFNFNFATIQNI